MSHIPELVKDGLVDPIYVRRNPEMVGAELAYLAVRHDLLRSFMERYEGPFWSERLGYELLDLFVGDETVKSATEVGRLRFNFPDRLLILSRLSAGQVVVLDTSNDKVYEVDFEGGEGLLLRGELSPRWESLYSFMADFFSGGVQT